MEEKEKESESESESAYWNGGVRELVKGGRGGDGQMCVDTTLHFLYMTPYDNEMNGQITQI